MRDLNKISQLTWTTCLELIQIKRYNKRETFNSLEP